MKFQREIPQNCCWSALCSSFSSFPANNQQLGITRRPPIQHGTQKRALRDSSSAFNWYSFHGILYFPYVGNKIICHPVLVSSTATAWSFNVQLPHETHARVSFSSRMWHNSNISLILLSLSSRLRLVTGRSEARSSRSVACRFDSNSHQATWKWLCLKQS